MSDYTDEQRALLDRRRADLPKWIADSATISEDFIRMVCAADPAPFLASYELFVPAIDEMAGAHEITPDDVQRMRTPLFFFIAEYLVRVLHGAWTVDEVASSQYFGQYMIDVPLAAGGLLRLSPYHLAQGFLTAPAPRSLAAALTSIGKRVRGEVSPPLAN